MTQGGHASFWARVEEVELTGCWVWCGRIARNHYGTWSTWENGKTVTVYAHRHAYELLVGPIPPKLVLDHLCRHRACVNPAHLDPVEQAENVRRGRGGQDGATFQRQKTHCPQGHPYEGENLYVRKDGSRGCRACARAASRRRRESLGPVPRKRKQFCKRGHEFTPENTYVSPSTGSRACRTCKRAQVQAHRSSERVKPPVYKIDRCKNGHAFDEGNTHVDARGYRTCRACSRAKTNAYRVRNKAAKASRKIS